MNAIRQAALVVARLERDEADDLLERMPPEQAQAIRDELPFINDKDVKATQEAIGEFLESSANWDEPSICIEEPASKPIAFQGNSTSLEELLRNKDSEIAEVIRHERASIVSALLRSMPQKRAANLLRMLSPSTQWLVLNHLNRGQVARFAIVEAIADRICELLSHKRVPSTEPEVDALLGIFRELNNPEQNRMLRSLESQHPMLAQRLRASTAVSRATTDLV